MLNLVFQEHESTNWEYFESQYREKKGSNMQEIGIMEKYIYWFMNKMSV